MGFLTSATAGLSIGATGGSGGAGGAVTVDSSAAVSTEGDNSVGILAQSVGGGGGTGGGAGGSTPSIKSETSTLRIAIGGSGGQGMTAGTVKVTTRGEITTRGRESHGVLAQSLGGGGGNGGLVMNEVFYQKAGKDPRAHVSLSIGGFGGMGGTGNNVDVVNQGSITTVAEDSVGIFAQSIGGGGGSGSTVITGSLMGKAGNDVYLGIGGVGGLGGSAGDVTVKNLQDDSGNAASIKTYADNSYGILAMSVGGGGGNGGTAITTSAAGKGGKGDKTTVTFGLSVGGLGGMGNVGGNTIVENAGNIMTFGKSAHGIIAQSIGGGGGNGGLAITGDLSLGATGTTGAKKHVSTVALGGVGGLGNNAGNVVVENSGTIEVKGDNADGIYAQSVGGGGGTGGFSVALSRNLLTNPFQPGVMEGALLNIGVGGVGGAGGSGGDVTVNHTGSITCWGDNAYGIFAQTVAGGGGSMNYSLSSPVWMAAELSTNLTLGLVRDTIDKAFDTTGKTTINVEGNITMSGQNSHASQIQTVNGGGGNLNLFMDVSKKAMEIGADGIEVPSNDPMLSNIVAHITAPIQVGAKMAWKEAGGDLAVHQIGSFLVLGSETVASQLQSIGGGGGSTIIKDIISEGTDLSLNLLAGAEDTFASDGGNVTARKEGGIYTTNEKAQGASYQSVGGGGGHIIVNVKTVPKQDVSGSKRVSALASFPKARAAKPLASGNSGATATIALGAAASKNNNGGNLDITNIGDTLTRGAYSSGLILQSIGAGGADIHMNGLDSLAVTIGGRNGSSGDGGNIRFSNTGVVETAGVRSHGIILQSIGGGGGALFTDLDPAGIALHLSNECSGSGGDITFHQQGAIQIAGDGAYGVLAQSLGGGGGMVDTLFAGSAGGSGSGGNITMDFDDNVVASGLDSTAIFAQSTGNGSSLNGNISLTLNGALVMGGSGTGVGVHFAGGRDNMLVNHALLMTADDPNGMAILGTNGNERIDNFGTVIGNVDLGGGSNTFINHQNCRYLSGAVANLGSGGRLLNAGVISPGGAGNPQTTTLSGEFIQSNTGEYLVDVDFAGNHADRISVSGKAEVGGQVNLNTLNPGSLLPGDYRLVIVSGEGGVTNSTTNLLVPSSAVVDYKLVTPNADSLAVGYDVNFSPEGLHGNLAAIGNFFNTLQLAGGSEEMAPVVTQIFNLPDFTSLAEAYHSMNPDYFDHFTKTSLVTERQYNRSLLGRIQSVRLAGKIPTGLQQSMSLTGGSGGILLAFNGTNADLLQLGTSETGKQQSKRYGFWLNGFGQKGKQSSDEDYDGYTFTSHGVAVG
ncbi:MAG: hypothetical protein GXP01_07220, partial [Alphaproteobacteria bacterium]|nr:hypothetical protein [Alphaproteobacteria bacterium]